MPVDRQFLLLLNKIKRRLPQGLSLGEAAGLAGQSRFKFHRQFRQLAGETFKQYVLRLQLESAAGDLVASPRAVATIAYKSGFKSHEVFTRAFRRHFGLSPAQFRERARGISRSARGKYREALLSAGPCIPFYRVQLNQPSRRPDMPLLSVTRKDVKPQPILFIRRRFAPSEVQNVLAECFGKVFQHAQKVGAAIVGNPMARWIAVGPGMMTVDAAVPIASPAAGDGEIESGEMQGGPVAFGIHAGPYDKLGDTYAEMQKWIEANNLRPTGPHWEWYVTDPADYPDPKDWRTEVYWPLEK